MVDRAREEPDSSRLALNAGGPVDKLMVSEHATGRKRPREAGRGAGRMGAKIMRACLALAMGAYGIRALRRFVYLRDDHAPSASVGPHPE